MTVTRSVRFGAAWLLGIGVLVLGLAVYGFMSSRWACGEESGNSFACDLSNIAVVIGAIVAAVHLATGAAIWRGRIWGAALGAVIGLLGALGCASLLSTEPWWLVLPASAGYLATSLVLAYAITGWWDPGRRLGHA